MAYKELHELCSKEFNQNKCIVLGNGTSVKNYKYNPEVFTIGVNDICKFVTPDILFIIDTKKRFEARKIQNRITDIENSTPPYFVTKDKDWNFPEDNTYIIEFGAYGKFANIQDKNTIDTGLDSPYMGIQLAYKLGFRKIGILGVDYTPNHFYAADGNHELVTYGKMDEINCLYKNLYGVMTDNKCSLFNLNRYSNVTSLPFLDIENF